LLGVAGPGGVTRDVGGPVAVVAGSVLVGWVVGTVAGWVDVADAAGAVAVGSAPVVGGDATLPGSRLPQPAAASVTAAIAAAATHRRRAPSNVVGLIRVVHS
jgi:hypothetical protein